MAKCPNCGNETSSLKTERCRVCGKEGCKKCVTYLLTFFLYGTEPAVDENWFSHLGQCYETFAEEIENNITLDILERDKFGVGLLRGVFFNAIQKSEKCRSWLSANCSHLFSLDDFLFPNANLELVARVERAGKKL